MADSPLKILSLNLFQYYHSQVFDHRGRVEPFGFASPFCFRPCLVDHQKRNVSKLGQRAGDVVVSALGKIGTLLLKLIKVS